MLKLLLVFLISVGSIAYGQETGKARFTTMAECKAAVESGEFVNYLPSFLNRHREAAANEEVRPLEERACVEMRIVGGKGFVPQAKGERFIFSAANGQPVVRFDCGNEVYSIEYVPVPPEAPHSPVLTPEPEPEPVLPPEEPSVELVPLPPPPDWPARSEFRITLVWDKPHKFPIPCVPREKGWFGIGVPIAECVGLAAAIGIPFIGGGHAVTAIVAIGHKIVPITGVIGPP